MFKRFDTISTKVSILYILLAIISTSFFTIIIFENQVDLITDNTRYQAKEVVGSIIASLKKFSSEISSEGMFTTKTTNDKINHIDSIIKPIVTDYFVFTQSGSIIYKSDPDIVLPETYIQEGAKSITNKDFSGKDYHLRINEKSYELNFYIPLDEYRLEDMILFINYKMKDIGKRLNELYSLITVIIIIISIFHILFALILFRIIIKPIQLLNKRSNEIASGYLSARVDIKRNDELGSLGKAFNAMADSIQEKIDTLEEQMHIITESRKEIVKMSITDELTGLYNRRYLFNRLQDEMNRAKRYNNFISFIMIDIDNFKKINDTYGHQIGDIVLKEVANTIKQSCRGIDILARYGGEEFSVIAPGTDIDDVFALAERIRQSVENNHILCQDDLKLTVTISLGISSLDEKSLQDEANQDTLVKLADNALYKAKKNGKNRTEVLTEAIK